MSEETKKTAEIPVLSISKEELEKNKKSLESAKSILTPPEGQVLAGMRAYCPVHGDITRASKIIKHTIYKKNEETGNIEPVSYSDVVCLACLSELWRSKVVANYPKDENGEPGDIKIAPVFISKEEYEALVKEQMAAEQARMEAQKKAQEAETATETATEAAEPKAE